MGVFITGKAKEDRAKLAREANAARRRMLDELRHGVLSDKPLHLVASHPQDHSFKQLVEDYFETLLTREN